MAKKLSCPQEPCETAPMTAREMRAKIYNSVSGNKLQHIIKKDVHIRGIGVESTWDLSLLPLQLFSKAKIILK